MSSQQNKNSVSDRVYDQQVCSDRMYVAQQVLAAVRKVSNITIKGGFVRDGGYLTDGGVWAASSSDIDLEIISDVWIAPGLNCEDLIRLGCNKYKKYIEIRKNFIDVIASVLKLISVKNIEENMLQGMYCGDLYRMVVQHQKTQVSIDICFDPTWELDFDVNALALDSEQKVVSKSDDVSLVTTRDNIEKKQFRVMWNPIWKKSRQLEIIHKRIKKMEARGWKCLNRI